MQGSFMTLRKENAFKSKCYNGLNTNGMKKGTSVSLLGIDACQHNGT